jgi:hypothetical protein
MYHGTLRLSSCYWVHFEFYPPPPISFLPLVTWPHPSWFETGMSANTNNQKYDHTNWPLNWETAGIQMYACMYTYNMWALSSTLWMTGHRLNCHTQPTFIDLRVWYTPAPKQDQRIFRASFYSSNTSICICHPPLPPMSVLAAAHWWYSEKYILNFLSSRNNFLDGSLVLCFAANYYASQWVDVYHESCWQTCKAISLTMFKYCELEFCLFALWECC